MTPKDIADQYFTFEERLASFQTAQPVAGRRTSKANAKTSRTKKWTHKTPRPEDLAKAGFFFHPKHEADDNTICFLCHANIDGWAKDDNPLAEHVQLSPSCAWAVLAAIEAENEEDKINTQEDPSSERMIEAREATFAGRWPHDSKKGWKCKTKQMVAAGWKYTPTNESDDMATCSYCSLALDGWDPSDKPREEHLKRSKDCLYFQLAKRNKSSKRASAASRLSIQSEATLQSEARSFLDATADEGDSILTTATNATMKKTAKAKKAPSRGRATRAKKAEPIEVMPDVEPEPTQVESKTNAPAKATKGRKRKSEEIEESIPTNAEAGPPPSKRRTTKTRGSIAQNSDVSMADDDSSRDASNPYGKKRGSTRSTRKTSNASKAPLSSHYVNDDELDAALEADLERPLSGDEVQPVTRTIPPKKPSKLEQPPYADHAMFGLRSAQNDEAAIEAELNAMEIDHVEVAPKSLPKVKNAKGRQPRKVSAKQHAAAKKAAEAQAAAEAEAEAEQFEEEPSLQIVAKLEQSVLVQHSSPIVQPKRQKASSRQPARKPPGRSTRGSTASVTKRQSASVNIRKDDSGNETDGSIASEATIVRGDSSRRASSTRTGKGGKKAASRHIDEIVNKTGEHTQSHELEDHVPSAAKGKRVVHLQEVRMTEEKSYTPSKFMEINGPLSSQMFNDISEPHMANRETHEPSSDEIIPPEELEASTPRISKTKTAKAKVVIESPRHITPPPKDETPSQSPQSSDAENHPPSSKPSAATRKVTTPHSAVQRVPLGAMTPSASPSKRNIISGLQTMHPWTEVDLDTIVLRSPDGENVIVNSKELFGDDMAKSGTLTSPEKRMTVEEWIKHNAEMAETKLKAECERMVSSFESQGTRAMVALEGIECLE